MVKRRFLGAILTYSYRGHFIARFTTIDAAVSATKKKHQFFFSS